MFTFLHLYSNYRAVSSVIMETVNMARLHLLVTEFLGQGRVMTPDEVGQKEPVFFGMLNCTFAILLSIHLAWLCCHSSSSLFKFLFFVLFKLLFLLLVSTSCSLYFSLRFQVSAQGNVVKLTWELNSAQLLEGGQYLMYPKESQSCISFHGDNSCFSFSVNDFQAALPDSKDSRYLMKLTLNSQGTSGTDSAAWCGLQEMKEQPWNRGGATTKDKIRERANQNQQQIENWYNFVWRISWPLSGSSP